MPNRIFIGLILLGFSCGKGYSQNIDTAKLDSFFDILALKKKAMGSVALTQSGKTLYNRAIGYSLLSSDEKKPSTTATKYRIGSITKTFTATMIFQLIEEGKLALTTTLDTYFPGVPNAKQITISSLLNHRSGLHNFTDDPDFSTWMTHPKTHDEVISLISQYPVDFQPNEKGAYSNSNYVLLGYILEKVCKKPYPEILKEHITTKIGLQNTYYGSEIRSSDNEAYSYHYTINWLPSPESDMSIPGGAGGIVSTPTDLDKFIQALFSNKLVSENSLLKMRTIINGFGMGLLEAPFHNKKCYGHTGGIDGFLSRVFYFPDDSMAIAYCSNGQVYPINDIMIGVLSIYYGMDFKLPDFTPLTLKAEDLDKYLGSYSSAQLTLKINVTKQGNTLIAKATDQSSFILEAIEKNKFKFDPTGIRMDFDPDKNEMTLKQGGGSFLFAKEK